VASTIIAAKSRFQPDSAHFIDAFQHSLTPAA
jgi:hypothetical protein